MPYRSWLTAHFPSFCDAFPSYRRHTGLGLQSSFRCPLYQTPTMLWDYIVVGGGLSGAVISHRLFEQDPTRKILVVEAGKNPIGDPSIVWSNSTNLVGGAYDWNISTVPQINLNNRSVPIGQGKGLGGGTIINSCPYSLCCIKICFRLVYFWSILCSPPN